MALTNYEKQKRWREKNRALYNLQQRNRRKNISGSGTCAGSRKACSDTSATHTGSETQADQPTRLSTIEELRELVASVPKTVENEPVKPVIFRNDNGGVITEAAWNKLQELKRRAKEGGYEIDEYSQ